jgi:hypothetical protein
VGRGGVVAAAAPHIPKAQSYEDKLAMSDRHRTTGLKVERQIALLDDPSGEYKRECARYVIARYTDCIAEDAKDPPELPVNATMVAKEAPMQEPREIAVEARVNPSLSQVGHVMPPPGGGVSQKPSVSHRLADEQVFLKARLPARLTREQAAESRE